MITAITQFSGNNEPGGVQGAKQTGNANTRWELKLNILVLVIVFLVSQLYVFKSLKLVKSNLVLAIA